MNLQDPKDRKALRDTMELVCADEKPDAPKWRRSMLMLARESVICMLQPLLPDPSKGTGDLAVAMVPTFMRVLLGGKAPKQVLLTINEPDEDTQARIDALGWENPIPDDLEPWVLLVPWELYEAANERNMMRWAMENAPPMEDK